ncbi:hypothetical protein [Listeria cornellensis]|uniref:Uncharacterized protein n=1 Tax=Listeria cornellensis FSL F6-0969 TaxID=1265820 RepID=W7BN83_9LIST|nr:hypothetical protein [Listeria cornellensis]EUJ27347.1 hypothetical protein PCORN_13497 [Listeria cornellensis FSL F6-0969]
MNISKLEKLANEDLNARKARATFYGIKSDESITILETELKFRKYGLNGEIPPEWIERYGEEE